MRSLRRWWLLLIPLLALNLWLFWPRGPAGTEILYSAFVAQARLGNIASVRITGDEISGSFIHAVRVSDLVAPDSLPADDPRLAVMTQIFGTTYPDIIGDSSLMPLLEEQNVLVDVVSPPASWTVPVLLNLLPVTLLVWSLLNARRSTAKSQGQILSFARSRARRQAGTMAKVNFGDVAGAEEAKAELVEIVEFLRHPRRYHEMGAHIPRGVLLVGPPGTGKTLLARAVSGEAGVPFFHINATEFVEIFVGIGASRVRDLFDQAKRAAPAIVFIDELDAVGRRRESGMGSVSHEREQTLNQLLVEMDGFEERHEVIVMAATNRPDVLDSALLRPGRFDRHVTVGLPDRAGRQAILQIHTRHLNLAQDVDLPALARSTIGFSGADLANLANEAALAAVHRNHSSVASTDFEEALDKILLGGERPLLLSQRDRRIIAYHEAGHALVAWLTPSADPVRKVTIVPRGRALGITQQIPGEDQYNYTRTYLLARLAVMLGGRAAEEITLGDVTTGAEEDLVQASQLARRMITRWGMGVLGLASIGARDDPTLTGYGFSQTRVLSEEASARVDRNVQQLLDEQYHSVCELLTSSRHQLDRLAQTLLDSETLDQKHLEQLLGSRSQSDAEMLLIPEPTSVCAASASLRSPERRRHRHPKQNQPAATAPDRQPADSGHLGSARHGAQTTLPCAHIDRGFSPPATHHRSDCVSRRGH